MHIFFLLTIIERTGIMYLLFDIGGTKMRVAFSRDGKVFGEPMIIPTPQDFRKGILLFRDAALELSGGGKIEAVAGGIAGPLDREKTMLVNSPHISGWIKKPLKKKLQEVLKAPVYVENDAAMVGLGEAAYGKGKGRKIVVYMTVSTGVGGSRIIDGKIDESAMGFEPGHQIIDPAGTLCPECKSVPGYLERYISGSAIEKRYKKKAYEISDPKVWEEEARFLAYGLNNTIVHWSPDIVILGGSVAGKVPLDRVRFHLGRIVKIFPKLPPIRKAVLGDVGGLYGALHFLRDLR
jgi:predicted NBD/HSP70 family sugar kinase